MNVYDFDHTIYDGDSSLDFVFFCMNRHWPLFLYLPFQVIIAVFTKIKIIPAKRGKELFFSFLRLYPVDVNEIMEFWKVHKRKITSWFIEHQRPDDLIISASPEFLLKPLVEGILNKSVIATNVDTRSGKIIGHNCKGEEKVRRFFERFPRCGIESFYSDSMSDAPLAEIAAHAYLVSIGRQNTVLAPWPSRRN